MRVKQAVKKRERERRERRLYATDSSSRYIARRVHESSIGMKVGAGLPTARLFADAAFRAAFPLGSSRHRHARHASPAIPGFASACRNYGNIARLAKGCRRFPDVVYENSRCLARLEIDMKCKILILKKNFPSKYRDICILRYHMSCLCL